LVKNKKTAGFETCCFYFMILTLLNSAVRAAEGISMEMGKPASVRIIL
jgi:hypothetical protein